MDLPDQLLNSFPRKLTQRDHYLLISCFHVKSTTVMKFNKSTKLNSETHLKCALRLCTNYQRTYTRRLQKFHRAPDNDVSGHLTYLLPDVIRTSLEQVLEPPENEPKQCLLWSPSWLKDGFQGTRTQLQHTSLMAILREWERSNAS
jgi:hypothetical protein